jgi:hypothetical protein
MDTGLTDVEMLSSHVQPPPPVQEHSSHTSNEAAGPDNPTNIICKVNYTTKIKPDKLQGWSVDATCFSLSFIVHLFELEMTDKFSKTLNLCFTKRFDHKIVFIFTKQGAAGIKWT